MITYIHHQLQAELDKLNEDEKRALCIILKELQRAKAKHPNFAGFSLLYACNIVTEEVGELARSVNLYQFEGKPAVDMETEASHVGATALRMIHLLQTR
jgi:NTP pyrophosphatase (non-canonical NTP hydrolase)